jgi:ferredoxin-NADP reductase
MAAHPILTATLERSLLLSDATKHLEFRVNELDRFEFAAGQFVSVKEPQSDGRFKTRAYSIASPPRGNNRFELCLNRVEEGFMSNHLCDLDEGAVIHWHGPHGLFTLQEPRQDSIFIATGTGIAPFRSMLHWLFADRARNRDHEFWLVYGTRYETDIYYADEFCRLQRENPNFHYVVTLSRGGGEWQGKRGYVQEHVRELVQNRPGKGVDNTRAYICGLNQMVSDNRQLLASFGWDKKQILYERYD